MIRSIMNPEESVKEEYQLKTVLTLDGQIYQGIVREESSDRIVLKQADGTETSHPDGRRRGREDRRLPDAEGADRTS